MKKYLLSAGTYDFTYYLVIGKDCENIIKFVRFKFDDKDFEYHFQSRGAFFGRFNLVPILWLPQKPKTPREYATLAHECLHLVNYMLIRWAEMSHNLDSEEAFAHQLSKCMTDCLEKLK